MALSQTIVYCENSDLQDIYPRISEYDHKVRIYNFIREGRGNDWVAHNTGLVERLFRNGKDLGEAKKQLVDVTRVNDWIYYADQDRLLVYLDISLDNVFEPNSYIFESGENYTTILLRLRRKASRLIESFLGSTISREIMKDREGNYPTSIIQATALKSVILFIAAHNSNHPDLVPLNEEYDDIIGKIKGNLQPLASNIVMSGQRSKDDSKGLIRIVTEGSDQHGVYPVELSGSYNGSEYELLKVEIKGSLLSPFYDDEFEVTDGICSVNPNIPPITGSWFSGLYTESECIDNGYIWLTDRKDNPLELFYSVWGKSSNKLKDTLLVDNELVSGDFQTLGISNMRIRWGFSEWKAGSGDIFMGLKPLKLPYGTLGTTGIEYPVYSGTTTFDVVKRLAVFYTGPDGETVQDLTDEGLLPNINGIITEGVATTYIEGIGWAGTLTTLYNIDSDEGDGQLREYAVKTTAAQDEIMYKDGLPIWSDYQKPAEYEIELWGANIQPTTSQINSVSMIKRGELWQ